MTNVLLLTGLILTLPGCALFNKKDADKTALPTGAAGGTSPARFPGSNDPLINGGALAPTAGDAILAGRVIDGYSRPPANTHIKLVSMDPKDTTSNDVSVTPEGYFTIQGLKPGTNYKLVARGKNGERMMAGITYTTAPNVRVLIQVKEDFANSGTPDVPPSPAFQDKKNDATSGAANTRALPTLGAATPASGPEHELPAVQVPTPAQNPSNPAFNHGQNPAPANPNWSPGNAVADSKGTTWPPPLDITNPNPRPTPPALQIPKTPPPMAPGGFNEPRLDGAGPTRVPSCVLVGKQLVNFALNDINGEPWELKTSRKGRLVLLDFWSTNCIPCRESMPALVQLQSKHGGRGLEVIGIANESGGTPQEQAYRVNQLIQRLGVNYRQLLSGGVMCPVRTQLGVRYVPTLVLIDEGGWILWRHEGKPEATHIAELERLLQRRLGQ